MRIRKRFLSSNLYSHPPSDPQVNGPTRAVVQEHSHSNNAVLQLHPHGDSCVRESPTAIYPQPTSDPSDGPPQTSSVDPYKTRIVGDEKAPSPRCGFVAGLATDHNHSNHHLKQLKQKQQQKKTMMILQKDLIADELTDDKYWSEEEKSNDIRKRNVVSVDDDEDDVDYGYLQTGSCSQQVAANKWFEEDKSIPLKKRRGSFERRMNEETTIKDQNNYVKKAKMKCKTNKKCIQRQHIVNLNDDVVSAADVDDDDDDYEDYRNKDQRNVSVKKKSKRGNVIMEGSRCSRVNGRGWRCCQQTLVGYSLCEHHLGKGRLRSISSVRNRSSANNVSMKKKKKVNINIIDGDSTELSHDEDSSKFAAKAKINCNGSDDEGYDRKPLTGKKKRMKLGMVKARSISSLLGSCSSINGDDI